MAKKYEFQPDKPYSTLLNKLQLTKLQQKHVLMWFLYSLLVVFLLILQDVVLCRSRLYGGTSDLVPCGIMMICILEGPQRGSVFALAASIFYLLSGSSPGPHVLVLITALSITAGSFRQAYLHPRLPAMFLTAGVAMAVYEAAVFGLCLLLQQVTLERVNVFLVPWLLSLAAIPVLYPIIKAIGSIGGDAWKE